MIDPFVIVTVCGTKSESFNFLSKNTDPSKRSPLASFLLMSNLFFTLLIVIKLVGFEVSAFTLTILPLINSSLIT